LATSYSITEYFGANLAELLSDKIVQVHSDFNSQAFIKDISANSQEKSYTQRIELLADKLKIYLPSDYEKSLRILINILGPENPHEDGMFKYFYWVMPIGKFVEKFGLEHLELSLNAIVEITKRNTGEYAVRPYIRKHPDYLLAKMETWSHSDNFHLRRLASEGLRPKLPWAPKLNEFIESPEPVFKILENLKEDPIKFVQKSVANHLTDYLKVNCPAANKLLYEWNKSPHPSTKWIVKRATRKIALT
jgi:3-methyladenine DNA glycosylase AlkC